MRTIKHWALAAAAAAALTLAGCGGGGSAPPQATGPDPALGAAKMAAMAAMTAATAADTAADAAETAANAQTANMAADAASYALAQNAAMRARDAANAAQTASDAAAATDDTAEAQRQRDIAVQQQATAEAEQANAVKYAGMVADAQQAIDDENQRVIDVADARSRAMQSYMDADADATKAENAADMAEATAPGTPGAMAAREAATAARTAATAAKAAHDAITDGMTKMEADAQATMAATEAGKANSGYMTAKAENDTIQTAGGTGTEQQRVRDVMAATSVASDAAVAARASATAARTSATSAREAANAAREAYEMAMRARTDSGTAQEEYMEADTAATAAENAAMAAENAADAAEAAHMGIDPAGTAMAAQDAQMTAETKQGEAAGEAMTASTQHMTAMTASGDAATAAGVHVIALLIRANGQNITEPVLDNSGTPEDEGMTVAELREAATGRAVTALNTAAAEDDNGEDGTTATAGWPGDIAANPDATPPTEAVPGMLSIAVDPEGSGTPMTFRTAAAEDDPDTTDVDESMTMPKTAGNIAGLGGFSGYSISEGLRHAIVFTDKTQDDPPVAESAAVTFRYVEDEAVTTVAELALGDDKTGPTYTGVTWTPSGEQPLTGTLSCPEGNTNCDIQIDADGAITEISGYVFTGSREARAAVTAMTAEQQATANNDYLVFGVWLHEDADGNATADDPQFGAFAAGGAAVTTLAVEITGTAMYEGSATGVYTSGDSVDYFQGDATLTADFGANDAQGTITGMIDEIVAGGNAMDDVIYLNDDGTPDDGNMVAGGTFSGDARMGTATTVDAVTTYTHNGSWSGQFFNGTEDDTTTTDVNESHVAPDSVAGTFGVTGTTGEGDDAVTRSYLGAFGAHKQ